MSNISNDLINEIRSRINIVDIISEHLSLRKNGINYNAVCPFHNEKQPSFSINEEKQFFHCFGCGITGDVIQFIKEYQRIDLFENLWY